jgi:hypothetical protein
MRLRLVVLIALLATVLPACHRPPGSRAEQDQTHAFPAAAGKLVRLDVRSLDVDIEMTTGESIGVETRLEAHSSSRAAAEQWLERHAPKLDDSPSRLEITVPRRSSITLVGFLSTKGVVRVKLPVQCALEVHTSSGDVTIAGTSLLGTPARVETTSGDVTVRGGVRELLAETTSGDVHVAGAPLEVLDSTSTSGDVQLDTGAARAVIETSSGDIRLHDLGGDLTATATSGDVDARWLRLPPGSTVRVQTSSGNVTMRLPTATPLTGEVRTTSGRISSEFPGDEDRHGRRFLIGSAATAPEQPERPATAAGVSVKTTSGDVTLRKAKAEI